MYKKLNKIDNVSSEIIFLENRMFFTGTKIKSIEAWNLTGTCQHWVADFPGHICKRFDNQIFTSNLYFYDIQGNVLFKNISDIEYTFELQYGNLSLWKIVNEELKEVKYYVFYLDKKEMLYEDIKLLAAPRVFTDSKIVYATQDGLLICYDYIKGINFWQHDFSEECRYINYDKIDRDENELLPGKINYITPYGEDKIIVSCKWSKTFCIEIATGKILWENTYTGNREYIIAGDVGFAYSNGGGINKIDLKTGESLHADKRFHRVPEMPYYNDLHISTVTDGMAYHDGLLWARIYSNGYSFIVAINPYDYHYEWIHHVETTEKVMDIKFYNNRMYLHTSGSELHIYEKIE